MKYLRITILLCAVIILPYTLNSCGDTGVAEKPKVTGITFNNLATLNTNIDGYYEAWVSLQGTAGDHGDDAYRTLGKFNIKPDGSLVDPSGNAFSLNAGRIDLSKVEDGVISVEVPGDNDTILNGSKILGAARSDENGNLVFHLSMTYSHVLGSVAANLGSSTAKYILGAPSDTSTNPDKYKHGVWFAQDTMGSVPGLTVPAIPDTLDWVYEAWVFDVSIDTIFTHYYMGNFTRPNQPDNYAYCSISYNTWFVPGHEWSLPFCPGGVPDINDLTNGNYKIYITLEPKVETSGRQWPFNLLLFYGRIPVGMTFGQVEQLANTVKLPTGVMTLAYETK